MTLTEGNVYHVYNRGNNKQRIFFRDENYPYFMKGVERYVLPHCDLLAWCLMPNHFHFLIHANADSVVMIKDGSFERQRFSQAVKQLLSAYTKAINIQENRTGSLFQQKTKAVCVSGSHAEIAFHYIHQNPMKAGLVNRMEDWESSSFKEYHSMSAKSLCNTSLSKNLLVIDFDKFYEESYQVVNFEIED